MIYDCRVCGYGIHITTGWDMAKLVRLLTERKRVRHAYFKIKC